MELYDDALERISRIEIKNDRIIVLFDDNTTCLLARQYPSFNFSCLPSCGWKCRIKHGDAIRIVRLCLNFMDDDDPIVLKPDWVASITRSGRGWELEK